MVVIYLNCYPYIWKKGDIMLDVDTAELKSFLDNLKSLLDEYEEIKSNLFNQLKMSCMDWHDGNSTQFDNHIYEDRKESDLMLTSLKMRQSLFEFIYAKYNSFGKKIRCNLNKKSSLMGTFDDCLEELQDILNEFGNIDRSFYYSEQSLIDNQRRKIFKMKSDVKSYKENAKNLFSKIEEIEKEISAKIKELDEIKISDFDFNLQ